VLAGTVVYGSTSAALMASKSQKRTSSMYGGDHGDADTVSVTFTVSNARRIDSKILFALVDVEVQIAGVAFDIMGVQARRLPEGGTSVALPTFKDEGGIWRPAIKLPEEVRAPLADTVLAFLLEEGLARRKFEPVAGQVGALTIQTVVPCDDLSRSPRSR